MEQKSSYEVFVYKSPSVGLIQTYAQAIRNVLLNGVAAKEHMSGIAVNPENGYFTFNFTPPQPASYTPQDEAGARKQLGNIMSALAEGMKNYVRAGFLPEELRELFTASYFKQTSLVPVVDPVWSDVVQRWSAQFVVELDAVHSRTDRAKNKALLNEGFSLVFGSDAILEVRYFHLPLQKSGRETLVAAENSQGEQKKDIYYARNLDSTVLPFFISDKGMLPATAVSVLLDSKTQGADALSQQFPQESKPGFTDLPPVAYSPEAEQQQTLLQAMELGDDLDCTEAAFHIAIISYCNRLRSAVWQFNVDMDEEARGDSLTETVSTALMDHLIGHMAQSFGMVGEIGLNLFSLVQSDLWSASKGKDELSLKELSALWINRIVGFSGDFSTRRKMYQQFLKSNGYQPAQNSDDYWAFHKRLLLIANGNAGVKGLPSEIDVQRQLIQAYVSKGQNGAPGYIQCYLSYYEGVALHYKRFTGWTFYPTFENVNRQERVHYMVKKLWPGVSLDKTPFDLHLTVYPTAGGTAYFTRTNATWSPAFQLLNWGDINTNDLGRDGR